MRHAVVGVLGVVLSTTVAIADSDVAFVNLCRDGAAGSRAIDRLRTPVLQRSGMTGDAAGPLRVSLEHPLQDEVVDLASVESLREQAWQAYSSFNHKKALKLIDAAQKELFALPMSDAVKSKWFEVALLAGQAHLQAKRKARAAQVFRLAARFAPDKTTLDPGTYLPDIVKAYETALAASPQQGTLTINAVAGSFVSVDGIPGGPAPHDAKLDTGPHVITVVAPGYQVTSRITPVTRGKSRLAMPQEPLAKAETIPQLRRSLQDQQSAGSLKSLAAAAGVDKLLVAVRQNADGQVQGAVYNVESDKLGPWVPVASDVALLEQIRKIDLKVDGKVIEDRPPIVVNGTVTKPWYKKPAGLVAIFGGSAVIITGVALLLLVDRDDSGAIDAFCGFGAPCR